MTSPRNPQEPSAQTSLRTEAQSKETYVKAKARIAALYSRAGSRRSQGRRLPCPRPPAKLPAVVRPLAVPLTGARSRLSTLLTAACALAFTAAPALALKTHGFSTSFGSSGPGAGQLALSSPSYWGGIYLQTTGSGLAVNDADPRRLRRRHRQPPRRSVLLLRRLHPRLGLGCRKRRLRIPDLHRIDRLPARPLRLRTSSVRVPDLRRGRQRLRSRRRATSTSPMPATTASPSSPPRVP